MEIQTLEGQADEARRQVDEAAGEARRHEETLHTVEKTLVSLGHEVEAGEEEARRFERKAEVLDTERSVAERERDEARRVLGEVLTALTATAEDRATGDQRLEALAVGLVRSRAESDTSQRRLADARGQQATLTERVTAVHVECERLTEAHAELQGRIALARSKGREQRERHAQLRAELRGNEEELAISLAERDRVTSDCGIVQQDVQRARGDLEAREQALKERRRERDTLKEAVSQLEVERARVDADLDHLQRDCREAVGCTPPEAAAALDEEQRTRPVEELEDGREQLQNRIKRMGPVNVLAVEQSEELSERFIFLTAQREDLVTSIKDLEGSIRRIDKTSKERFKEAFAAIDELFGKVFTQLFGGGTAGLRLLDEQDVLESGIDILAQPPGKRLQNVMLLSGGEKALTAIGLLLAIFSIQAVTLLHPGRGGRPARRRQHRALRQAAGHDEGRDPVRPDHAQQEDDGDRRSALRRHDGRARGQQAGQRSIQLSWQPVAKVIPRPCRIFPASSALPNLGILPVFLRSGALI